MRRIVRTVLTIAFGTLLAACGGGIVPSDIAALDGAWAGDIGRTRFDQNQCKIWGLRLSIRGGAVTGEAFDLNAQAAPSRFDSYVETDGQMFIDARVGGEVVRISGRFSRNSFSGTARTARGCDGRVSLSRVRNQ